MQEVQIAVINYAIFGLFIHDPLFTSRRKVTKKRKDLLIHKSMSILITQLLYLWYSYLLDLLIGDL